MQELSLSAEGYVIIDIIAPLPEFRDIIDHNVLIWMDTIAESRYEDTNKMFVPPEDYNYRITTYDSTKWAKQIYDDVTDNLVDFFLLYT